MSSDVVLTQDPTYLDRLFSTKVEHGLEVDVPMCDNNIRNCLNLIGRDDMLKLTNDRDLMYEMTSYDTDNVLYYLIVMNPISGMIYGALYAIRRLFYYAFQNFLIQYSQRSEDRNKRIFFHNVFDKAVIGGDLEIYKSCVRFLGSDYTYQVYMNGIFDAMIYDHTDIFNFIIKRINTVYEALTVAVRLDKLQFIQPLIDECIKRYDSITVEGIIRGQIGEAVRYDSNRAFRELISYDGLNKSKLQDIKNLIIRLKRKKMIKEFNKHIPIDINNMLLSAISSKNTKMVRSLLGLYDYDRTFLHNQLLTVVLADNMDIKQQKTMIDIFMDRLKTAHLGLYINIIDIPEIKEYLLTKYKSSTLS